MFGVSRNTVTAWLKKALNVPPLAATVVAAQPDDVLELDELWTFVGHRRQGVICMTIALPGRSRSIKIQIRRTSRGFVSNYLTHRNSDTPLNSDTPRQIVAYALGPRNDATAR